MLDFRMMTRPFYTTLLVLILLTPVNSYAFWMWTPESGKWENPKFAVKETPVQQLEFAMDYYRSKEYDMAVREFNKLISHYPKSRQAADAQYFIGVCAEEQKRYYEAFKAYQLVIDKYPYSDRATDIIQKEFDIGVKLMEGQGNKNVWAQTLTGSEYDVVDVFKTVIKNAPYGELAASSQYKIGLYMQEKGLFQEARDEFEKVINDYPDSTWARAAQYQIALSDSKRSTDPQYDQKTTQVAMKEFEQFVEENPEAELSVNAKEHINTLREKDAENNFVVGSFYEKHKNFKAAKIYYQTIVNDYSDTIWARQALERLRLLGFKE